MSLPFSFPCARAGVGFDPLESSMHTGYILKFTVFQSPTAHPYGQDCSAEICVRSVLLVSRGRDGRGRLRVGFQVGNHGSNAERHLLTRINERGGLPGGEGNGSIPRTDL